ncbi:cytochrome c [Stappia sp. F7233]|uniref:Cytochrome c n=1 Tax=Stappia albiluteola TaxID=2758565 RepID=A0A839AD42_9HYPH|nr:cytochrome c [Stappia albiluteola]MBA5777583.1 cytochrome c [Stappia albiluteola]
MFKKALAVFAIGMAAMAGSSFANDDPVATRQNLMKSVGLATGTLGKMVKGELPYDPITAELAMRVIFTSAVGYVDLFPEGSGEGANTEASPKIWEDKAGFDAVALKLEQSALAAIPASKEGLDSLKANFGSVAQNCRACHENYRVKKN